MVQRTGQTAVRTGGLPHRSTAGQRFDAPNAALPVAGDCLYELRFDLGTVSWRITYFFTEPRRIVLLTVFRKQRNNERHELNRAHAAKARCIAEGQTADED